ncbi:transcriptional regulator [Kribbella soli]|uniref:Transcriptional regulator n=1 Tax=Kribbella soli TaxID=1124743 RepID=A0A4R0HLN0_9ACTN|nr:transcriptional regulator [Kribbella soli]
MSSAEPAPPCWTASPTPPAPTSELAQRLDISPASTSEQTRILRDAGLIASDRDGRRVVHTAPELGPASSARAHDAFRPLSGVGDAHALDCSGGEGPAGGGEALVVAAVEGAHD